MKKSRLRHPEQAADLRPEWHSKLPSGWQRVISLKWQREEYRLGDDSGLSNLLMPGVSYSYLKSDNRIDPHNGYRLQFESKVAKEGLGRTTTCFTARR
jgi:translocation and assembly module TamA